MKVAFVHIPKTAGGSIHTWLKDNHENHFEYHTGHRFLNEIYETNGVCDFSFTCTRNTYSRMISLYNWNGHKLYRKYYKSGKTQFVDEISAHEKGIVEYMYWARENNKLVTISQLEWIKGVDIILTQENLKEDFKIIQNKLNCYNTLPTHVHKRNYVAKDFYTKDFKLAIEDLFGDEIEHFKYLPKY